MYCTIATSLVKRCYVNMYQLVLKLGQANSHILVKWDTLFSLGHMGHWVKL